MATHHACEASVQLAALFAQYREADAALDRFYETEFNPAVEVHNELVLKHRAAVELIPHVEEIGGPSVAGPPVIFTTRAPHTRRLAENLIACDAEEPNRSADWNITINAARRFIAADDVHTATIRELGPEPANDPALEASEIEALAPVRAAREAIYAFPCSSLADLQAKLAWIEADEGMDGEDLLPLVVADVRRLLQLEEA